MLYIPRPGTRTAVRNDAFGSIGRTPPDCLSGGGGLVSTAADCHRFTQFLLGGGELDGGGAASTAFWVDPANEVTALFFTQLLPSSAHPIRQHLRQLVYQALV